MINRFIKKENHMPILFIVALIFIGIVRIEIQKHNIKVTNEKLEKQRKAHAEQIKENEGEIVGDSFDKLEYSFAQEEKQELTEKEREFYYNKATEHIGGAGEFRKISPHPNRNGLTLKFHRNYENIYKASNLIIVKDTFEYLNDKGEYEKYRFRSCLSEEGDLKAETIGGSVK